jgi:phosphatidylserine synthase
VKLGLGTVAALTIAGSRFDLAAWYITLAAVLDLVDVPRVERNLRLADPLQRLRIAVSALVFGVVPGFLAFRAYLGTEEWAWALSGVYALAAALGAARSKVEPDHRSKPTTQGLPVSVSAVVLATIYPFFTESVAAPWMSGLPDPQEIGGIMICLLILMLSPITYPLTPRRSSEACGRYTVVLVAAAAVGAILVPETIVFPAFVSYTFWGVAESLKEGMFETSGGSGVPSEEGDPQDRSDGLDSYRARSTWD